ncbi:class I SAM-dependent methyltransferase [Dysgonomonas sp. GY617]|uniref:class I SAM-dependent methyltransferase n=1 Tax=Dysgonomonas sp. GY617 TaxID=2780420 RepID=UPI0018846A5A|nr:class I SAM-dependent methyltransferase [Dysgonomonas sp. GY617]MBF0576583.1 class I SAM-dependent methyltransferase [Dysgonomonas sp. GY617]
MNEDLVTTYDFNSNELVELLDELPFWAAPFGIKLLENIKIKKHSTILDIGFGAGFPLTELAMRFGNTSKVYGIDPWEAAIKRTEKKIAFYGIKNVEIIRGVAENIPLNDHSVDLITSNNGLNNVSDLDKSLSECSRIMKSGGQFIQTMNINRTMIEFYDIMEIVLNKLNMKPQIKTMREQIYTMRKPVDEITQLIEKHGFSINRIIEDKFSYTFADGTTMLQYYFIRLAFLDSWKSIIPKDKQAEVFGAIEELINREAERKGYFELTVPFVVIDSMKI